MTTAGPSTKSYAEAAKTYRPPHDEALKASRPPVYTEVHRTYNRPPVLRSANEQVDREDGWTEVSSMTSCSWPSALDKVSSHGDKLTPRERNREPEDPPYDPYDWFEEDRDTRAESALDTKINSTARSQRLYDRVGSLACATRDVKPWHQFPGCRHSIKKAQVWSVKLTPIKLKHLKKQTMHQYTVALREERRDRRFTNKMTFAGWNL